MTIRWRLLLEGRQLLEGEWEAPTRLMTVFQEDDKYMHGNWVRLNGEHSYLAELDFDDPETFRSYPDIDPDAYAWQQVEEAERFGYKASVETITARLKLMGFTFERCRSEMARYRRELRFGGDDSAYFQDEDGETRPIEESDDAVAEIGLRAYLKAAAAAWDLSGLTELDKGCLKSLKEFFSDDLDHRLLLSGLLGEQAPQQTLRLDLSDLLSDGAFPSTAQISTQALRDLREETASIGPIIVITEGKYDSRVLSRALRLVRPDIAGYFKFLDFDATRAQGGTDRVVATLKSFAAAGVMNRVIGLVDNDTAGREAIKQLAATTLPKIYSVSLLPDLDYAQSYPTLGPSGEANDNINGRACSIEFYFGLACLQGPNGGPTPIQWKAFRESVQDYQGELTNKQHVQARIDDLLTAAEAGSPLDESWEPMRMIAQILIDKAEALTVR